MTRAVHVGWVLLLVGVLAGCRAESADKPVVVRPVVVSPVSYLDFEERLSATGQLLARDRAEVAAQVPGEITKIAINEGEAAAEGATVIEIDPERHQLEFNRARASVAEARAALQERERDMKRKQALANRAVGSKAQAEEAETAVQTARSRLQAEQAKFGVADRALRDSSVKARFEGLIARRHVSVGEYVQPGQKLFELVSLDPIEVEFNLPEKDSSRVKLGQSLEVVVAPHPDDVFEAIVSVVSPTIDSRTRTLRVKALLPNPEGRLRPGLFARVDLGVALRENVLMVPEEAVLQRADGAVMFRVVDGNRVQRIPVETGLQRGGQIEIVRGLRRGDSVVRRGHANLIDGSMIASRNADGTPAVSARTPVAKEKTE